MKLPDNSAKFISSFAGLTRERKDEITSLLASVPDADGQAAIQIFLGIGGVDARFVSGIFGLPLPAETDAPANKAVTAPHKASQS